MTDSEPTYDVAPWAATTRDSSGVREFFAVIHSLAVLALLATLVCLVAALVWEADQIRKEVQGRGNWTVYVQ